MGGCKSLRLLLFSSTSFLLSPLVDFDQGKEHKAKSRKKKCSEVGKVLKPATLERKLSLNSIMDGKILKSVVDLVFTEGADKEETEKLQHGVKDKFINNAILPKKSGSMLRVYSRLDNDTNSK